MFMLRTEKWMLFLFDAISTALFCTHYLLLGFFHHWPVLLFKKGKEVPFEILIRGSEFKFIMIASNF